MTWLPSLILLWLTGHCTVLPKPCCGLGYIIKNSGLLQYESLFLSEAMNWVAKKPSFTAFLQFPSVSVGGILALTNYIKEGKKKCLWAGSYACLVLYCSLKMNSVSLVTTRSFAQNWCICKYCDSKRSCWFVEIGAQKKIFLNHWCISCQCRAALCSNLQWFFSSLWWLFCIVICAHILSGFYFRKIEPGKIEDYMRQRGDRTNELKDFEAVV